MANSSKYVQPVIPKFDGHYTLWSLGQVDGELLMIKGVLALSGTWNCRHF